MLRLVKIAYFLFFFYNFLRCFFKEKWVIISLKSLFKKRLQKRETSHFWSNFSKKVAHQTCLRCFPKEKVRHHAFEVTFPKKVAHQTCLRCFSKERVKHHAFEGTFWWIVTHQTCLRCFSTEKSLLFLKLLFKKRSHIQTYFRSKLLFLK